MGKPEIVDWIKTKKSLKKINPEKLFTPAEIQSMLRVWYNSRDKALLAIAYETGMRIGELLSLRIEDLKITENECMIRIPDNHEDTTINAKTGTRSLILIESVPYIEKYLKVHDGNKWLFGIQKTRASYILKEMAVKAGITKNVYWHLLRHTRATEMARLGMQETAMKKRFGWTEDSGMIKRYTSLTDVDADEAYKTALGLGNKQKDVIINPIATKCAKCQKLIESGEFCPQCAEIQMLNESNVKARMKNEELQKQMDSMTAMFNKDVIEAMINARVKEMLSKPGINS